MREPMQMPKAYVRKLSFLFWFLVFVLDFVNDGPWWFFFPEAAVSAPFQLVMFSVAGIGGYLYMGNKVGRTSVVLFVFWGFRSCGCQIFVTGGWDAAAWLSQCHSTDLSGEDCGMIFFPKQMALQKEQPWGPAGWRVLLQVHVFQVHGSKKYTESCYGLGIFFAGQESLKGKEQVFLLKHGRMFQSRKLMVCGLAV